LTDGNDADYFRFRTIEAGGTADRVSIAFAYSDTRM